jgi:hypothetical protein
MKRCPNCGTTKPLSAFHRDKTKANGHVSRCKDCSNAKDRVEYDPEQYRARYLGNRDAILARSKAWSAANPEKVRQYAREAARRNPARAREKGQARSMKRHGGQDEWARMYQAQDGLCYLCQRPLPADRARIHVDHDHDCCPPGPGGRTIQSCQYCRRGLTHERCNQIWGLAAEDPALLRIIAAEGARVKDETRQRITMKTDTQGELISIADVA